MRKNRIDVQRFQIGDTVRVTSAIMSSCSQQVGQIVSVELSRHARTLDKYVVRLSGSGTRVFWDIQLEELPGVGIKGQFLRAELLARFVDLTPEDVLAVNGDLDRLTTFLQQRYQFHPRRARLEAETLWTQTKTRLSIATSNFPSDADLTQNSEGYSAA